MKSKVMRVARKREEHQVMIEEEQLEQVNAVKYISTLQGLASAVMTVCKK